MKQPAASAEIQAEVDSNGLNGKVLLKKFVEERSDTAIFITSFLITAFDGYPCNVTDIKEDYLKQDLAFAFQKDSEITDLMDHWIFKAQQTGDLSFWREKVMSNCLFFCTK